MKRRVTILAAAVCAVFCGQALPAPGSPVQGTDAELELFTTWNFVWMHEQEKRASAGRFTATNNPSGMDLTTWCWNRWTLWRGRLLWFPTPTESDPIPGAIRAQLQTAGPHHAAPRTG